MGQSKNGGILILDQWAAHPASGTTVQTAHDAAGNLVHYDPK